MKSIMFKRIFIITVFLAMTCNAPEVMGKNETASEDRTQNPGAKAPIESSSAIKQSSPVDDEKLKTILDGLEARYSTLGFTARFSQESTLKAMEITDTASGKVMVKRPGMMRWEYETPEPQTIITDGDRLWIYRPEDNQVMVGKAPAFFKDGKGAGFLSDMKLLRDKFSISLVAGESDKNLVHENGNDANMDDKEDDYFLKLVPEEQNLDLAAIFLAVDKKNFNIKNIVTLNAYEDETRIRITDYDFGAELENDLFRFVIPEGVDILEMEE